MYFILTISKPNHFWEESINSTPHKQPALALFVIGCNSPHPPHTYDVTANDVVLPELLPKVLKFAVSGFLPGPSVAVGEGFLTWNTEQRKLSPSLTRRTAFWEM